MTSKRTSNESKGGIRRLGRSTDRQMKQIFEKGNSFVVRNHEVANRIEGIERLCSPCGIECAKFNGKWGIGLKVGDFFMLVCNPLDLVSSIYGMDYPLSLCGDEETGEFVVECIKSDYCYEWLLSHTKLKLAGRRLYTFAEYQTKINDAIRTLYDKIITGEEIAYKPIDANQESIGLCIKQLEIKGAMPSHNRLLASDIVDEKFDFSPGDDGTKYLIHISDRGFQSFISDWDNDYDQIRHWLEQYVYDHKTTIRLSFDMSETRIRFQHMSIVKSIDKSGDGYRYKYHEACRVTIETDDIGKAPTLRGFCEETTAIRNFYEGLLLMRLKYLMACDINIYDFRLLNTYNMVKSPIIEQWLSGDERDFSAPIKRQETVASIWIIDPDYDTCIEEISLKRRPIDVENDTFENVNGKSFAVPGVSAWAKEISGIILKAETCREYDFDWDDYHKRGLKLAKELRSFLPTDFDLWYRAPFEDKSGIIPRPVLIIG